MSGELDRSEEGDGRGRSRWYHVVAVGIVAVAFVGFFVGTREAGYEEAREAGFAPEPDEERARQAESGPESARPAPTYGELQESGYEGNPHWRRAIAANRRASADDWRPKERPREANRAYDGAPPTVPHPVRERSAEACVACHDEGVRVGGENGPAMSHEYMTECVQCHASSDPKRPFSEGPPATVSTTNRFDGLESPPRGPRSYTGAPPRIPHRTQNRSECTSCHGEFGRPGPPSHGVERTECRQCHADNKGPPIAGGPPASVARGNRFAGLNASRRPNPGPDTGRERGRTPRSTRSLLSQRPRSNSRRNPRLVGTTDKPDAKRERGRSRSSNRRSPRLVRRRPRRRLPPQIPHQVHMRDNCLSCHAPERSSGVATPTSHPWRKQCQQCHAPTDRFDFRPPNSRLPFETPAAPLDDGGNR